MNSPHFIEFQSLVEFFNDELLGAQLQEIITNDNGIVLGFYRYELKPQLVWMIFDLDIQRPFVGLYNSNPWARLKSTKPMGLFLNANFKNNIVTEIMLLENMGRVMNIYFNTSYKIEFRLIPKQPNFISYVDKKQMAWNKPKDLVIVVAAEFDWTQVESRSVPYMLKQWLTQRELSYSKNKKQSQESLSSFDLWVNQRKKDIEKKTKALIALQVQIDNPKIKLYNKLGEYLKIYGFKNIPDELIDLVNMSQNVSWNIQNCFTKSKLAEQKISGALKRSAFIKEELLALEDLSEKRFQSYNKKQAQIKQFQSSRKKTEGNFRKLVLDEALGINCWMGKSAADNLQLLRQSKSWDLWIHLKDYPSAYAIVQKNKDQKISDEYIQRSAIWLIKEGSKNNDSSKVKTTVIIVECKHVRPIKGDKIGRVTYHNGREMLITT